MYSHAHCFLLKMAIKTKLRAIVLEKLCSFRLLNGIFSPLGLLWGERADPDLNDCKHQIGESVWV